MNVIRQRDWTEQELGLAGFKQFERIKQVVMARRLSDAEAPMRIKTEWDEELIAEVGYAICYRAGDVIQPTLKDYYHWPVEPYVFDNTYRPWDQREWHPSQTEQHLMDLGCRPFYKMANVWAKEVTHLIWMQSPEHEEPVQVGPGRYLVIGSEGEPYTMSIAEFFSRYEREEPKPKSIIHRLMNFFRG